MDIFICIVHKLKTGCQWDSIFIDLDSLNHHSLIKRCTIFTETWCKLGVFQMMFETYLEIQKDKLDTEKLNLDDTHSLVKKSAESSGYQFRKKEKTSNALIMIYGRGIPIAIGFVLKGNHNDLHQIVPQFSKMIKELNKRNIYVQNNILNADKGFDSKKFRRAVMRRKMQPNIKENLRNRKTKKRGKKRFHNAQIYKTRFVNESCFVWIDSS